MKKKNIILGSTLGLALAVSGAYAMGGSFTDVPEDHWAAAAIEQGKSAGLWEGYNVDGELMFKPDQGITRAEMAVLLDRNNGMIEDVLIEMNNGMQMMYDEMMAMQEKIETMEMQMNGQELVMYMASLNGDQEVPAVDTQATGAASFELKGMELSYDISVSDLSGDVQSAHIHMGAEGENGDPVHTITFDGMTASGTWTLTEEELKNLENEMYYVNVHTEANPNGEIRGQILPKL